MTDQEIIIAVAKLDGWTECRLCDAPGDYFDQCLVGIKLGQDTPVLPSYLTSRDAIIPVIEKFDIATRCLVASNLQQDLQKQKTEQWLLIDLANCITSTPKQLCIALLKATGEWKE